MPSATTKRKVLPAPREGQITREEASNAVKSRIEFNPTITINIGVFKELFYKAMWFELMEEEGLTQGIDPLLTKEREKYYRELMEAYRSGN